MAGSVWGKAWGAAFGAAWGAVAAARPATPAPTSMVYLGADRSRGRRISPAAPLPRHKTRRQREHADLLLLFKP